MSKLELAIISSGNECISLYRQLRSMPGVNVLGYCDIYQSQDILEQIDREETFTCTEIKELLALERLDVILACTDNPVILEQLRRDKPPGITIVEKGALDLFRTTLNENDELLEFKKIQGELSTVLNSVQEAIEVVNSEGIIKYVNPAFTKITGIPSSERIGKKILEVSPDGALANALKNGENIFGHRTMVGGSNAEVISNASPIIVEGKAEGAVVVFQHFTDVMKLMDELKKTTSLVENLSDKFGQVTTSKYNFLDILGNSTELKKCLQIAERASRSNSTVLLLGESGTGKELFAHSIHNNSPRRERPFIKVNCAAIPENLLESEFFGYAKGAFTGALKSKIGKFELANGGTIFLDEIGDMSLILQGKLLRVLQEMEFERIGGNQTIQVDVRVVAATNRNLRDLIRQGQFREDLYYRLNVVELIIPPLRVRKEDLPLLINNLIIKLNRKLGKKVTGLTNDAEEALLNYDWPGNIRELENVIERVMVTVDEEVYNKKHLIQHITQFKAPLDRDIELVPIEHMEQILIKKAMSKYGNSVEGKRRAAQALNISLATLYNKLKKNRSD